MLLLVIPDRLKLDWWRLRMGGGWCEVGEVLADGAGVMYLGVGTTSNTGPSYIPRVTPWLILTWKEHAHTHSISLKDISWTEVECKSPACGTVWVNTGATSSDEPPNSSWEASGTLQDQRTQTNSMLSAVSCPLSLGEEHEDLIFCAKTNQG